jgi:hypothetical protein
VFFLCRQELIKYAAKMLQVLMKAGPRGEEMMGMAAADKRNSGTVDAVIHMPDLFNVGK